MALSEQQRVEIWERFQNDESKLRKSINLEKSNLRAVVDALDDWWDTVQAAGNAAIPQPGRDELTNRQKKYLFFLLMQTIFNLEP